MATYAKMLQRRLTIAQTRMHLYMELHGLWSCSDSSQALIGMEISEQNTSLMHHAHIAKSRDLQPISRALTRCGAMRHCVQTQRTAYASTERSDSGFIAMDAIPSRYIDICLQISRNLEYSAWTTWGICDWLETNPIGASENIQRRRDTFSTANYDASETKIYRIYTCGDRPIYLACIHAHYSCNLYD